MHFQSHYFDLSQIEAILKKRSLNFLGFLCHQSVNDQYKKYFPNDLTQTNLENWAEFEVKHPNTFRGMYQFWVSKKKN